ncbi:hypothetical protein SteCoe_20702 [Stentor coeruleus]|uniref:RING-type domain-containing protein n=1 Tax=Stentor coeruleus TaxID=5963 RepID=A0A1R2BR83_9CILI|nr:hypothetical protein SteCoe_20702 [Stentor coeruleus]
MEKSLASIECLENLPRKAYYILGLLHKSTQLDLEILTSFITTIYSSELDQESLCQIEIQLYHSKIGIAKEILNIKAPPCLKCKFRSKNLLCLSCCHSYHKECLSSLLKEQILNKIKPCCPDCGVIIQDYEDIDPVLAVVYFEKNNSEIGQLKNYVKCDYCSQFIEVSSKENYSCPSCQAFNCGKCQTVMDYCICPKNS